MPAPFQALEEPDHLTHALTRSEERPVVLFKHSVTCPISAVAERQMRQFAEGASAQVYRLVVQRSRELSHEIGHTFGIHHQSPQVIVLYRGEAVFHASHRRVRADLVEAAVAKAGASTPG